ncbi:MAG: hypothetical protein D6694_00750, partial [Gammaproteobacteria bacterium]
EISGREFERAAMVVPFEIEGIRDRFIAQLDLGSEGSVLYENGLKNYFDSYPWLRAKIDSSRSVYFDENRVYEFKDIVLKMGSSYVWHRNTYVMVGFGDEVPKDSVGSMVPKHIGTIGRDLFRDNILILDYPGKRLCMVDALGDDQLRQFDTLDISIEVVGGIKMPIKLGDELHYVMFDTGSSIFPLLMADSLEWSRVADLTSNDIDTLLIHSWGRLIPIPGAPVKNDVSISVADKNVSDKIRVYYWPIQGEFFREENLLGIMGNVFFLNDVVMIDFKNNRLGILRRKT